MNFPQTVTVEVTADDIAHGKPGRCSSCPIALGVIRSGIGATDIAVGLETCWVSMAHDEHLTGYEMPDEALDFIDAFDNGRPVAPFSFSMERRS